MFSFLPHPNETTGNWVNSIIEDYGTSGTKPIFLIQHLFSPFQNPIGCSFQCPPPALVLGHSAICMLVLSEEPLWAADFSFHSPVPKCMPLQMRGLNWDRVLKAREQTGLVHLVYSLVPTARARSSFALAGLYQVVQQVYPVTLVKCPGQLSHCGPLGAFPHQPLLEHLVNLFFQPISFIVVVNFINLRLSEAQLSGTVFPLLSQVFPDRVQVFISQTTGVICQKKREEASAYSPYEHSSVCNTEMAQERDAKKITFYFTWGNPAL